MSIKALERDNQGSVRISKSEVMKRLLRTIGVVEEYSVFNSSLIECTIYAMKVDSDDGYLWMATDHGFWRGQLESGLSGNGSKAVVYPDPFIPGRGDVLGIAGIPDTPVEIRIFDLTGTLVYEHSCNGRDNIAWDGSNMDGDPAASGVYFLQLEQINSEAGLLKFALVR